MTSRPRLLSRGSRPTVGEWGGEMGRGRGRGERNVHSGNFLLRQCPALSQAGGGGEIGRQGAVALLEGVGEG